MCTVLPLITGLISSEAGTEKKDCYDRMLYFDGDWTQETNPKILFNVVCCIFQT